MRKILVSILVWAVTLASAAAQNITFTENIPADAAALLKPRLEAMLRGAGVADAPLTVDAAVTSEEQTSLTLTQTALTIELYLSSGAASHTITLRGVGDSHADAWQRAVKQFLPRSSATKPFTDQLQSGA